MQKKLTQNSYRPTQNWPKTIPLKLHLWVLVCLCLGLWTTVDANTPPKTTNTSIGNFIDEAGYLDIPAGFSGKLDMSGYHVSLDECEGPMAMPMNSGWSALGSGLNNICIDMIVDDNGDLYAVGDFTIAGGVTVNRVAKWDGSTWSALGTGVNGQAIALTIDHDGNIIVGGFFTEAGGQPASKIAKWDGSTWSTLGSGFNNTCFTLTTAPNGDIIAGGFFTQADGIIVNRIARWNGSTWSALGTGLNDACEDLEIDGNGNIIAGGRFTQAGGVSANYIAKWDGSTWSALGAGFNDICWVVTIDENNDIFAGGSFTEAGGQTVNYIAKWNGVAWSALGSGFSSICRGLTIDGNGDLIAGGFFIRANGIRVDRIAKWDGATWSGLDDGLNSVCDVLTIDGNGDLIAGGRFTKASGITVNYIAKYGPPPCDLSITNVTPNPETCPYEEDGSITITATCTSCTGILYSIDGGNTFEDNGGVFTNLEPGDYMPMVKDSGDDNCTDDSGQVTVDMGTDNEAPTVSCPSDINQGTDPGECTATIALNIPPATDNCVDVYTTLSIGFQEIQSPFAFLPGPTTVTVTAMDNIGNTSTCTFEVFIEDDEDPVINCPGDVTQDVDAGQSFATVTGIGATATDNCGNPAISYDISGATIEANGPGDASGTPFNVGQSTVTYYAVTGLDGSDCSFTVTVNPPPAPEIEVYNEGDLLIDNGTTTIIPFITDFGNVNIDGGMQTRGYYIFNNGDVDLVLDANPISFSNSSAFTVDQPTSLTIPPGNIEYFFITFDPTDAQCGTQDATVNIASNDANKNPYTFAIRGEAIDNIDPVISCPSNITDNNGPGICGKFINFSIPDPTDNCTAVTVTSNPASGAFFNVGTTPVTVTATDDAGNQSQCSFNVIINDIEAPTVFCPINITDPDDSGQCGATVTFSATALDLCSGATTVTANPASGAFFPIGTTPVNVTATDAAGNSSSCMFTVSITDTQSPTAFCPSSVTKSNDPGVCNAAVIFSIGATDNCPEDVTAFANPASGSTFNVGTTTVTVTATDAANNTSSCTFDLTVNDDEAPVMVCNNFSLSLTGTSTSITAGQMDGGSTDNCGITTLNVSPSTFTCSTLGAQTVTLTGIDAAGNSASCTGTVTVTDLNPLTAVCANPTVNLTSDGTTTVAASFFDGGSLAACAGLTFSASQTDFDCSDLGNTIAVTLTVTATTNNQTATCTANVSVADPQSFCCAPANAVCNNTTVMLDAGGTASITPSNVGSGSMAECGLMSEDVTPMNFDCNDVGTPVTVTYTIEDINGATSSCTATVTVEDNIAPTALCPPNLTLSADAGVCTAVGTSGLTATDSDNCTDNGTITYILSGATSGSGSTGPVGETFNLGVTTVSVTTTDDSGNTGTCSFTVTVEDDEAPVPVCQTTTIEIQPDGGYTLQESDVYDANASTDNCGIDQVSFNAETYECADFGQSFTINVTVTDAAGNTANCDATITVDIGDALPNGWSASDVGNTGTMGNSTDFDPCSSPTPAEGAFTISGGGNNATSSTTDNIAFAGQTICGDGTITAKIESVSPNGYGGLMIRETMNAGAKQVAIFSNLGNLLRHEVRYTTNGVKQVSSFFKPSPIWLRLQRTGDWVFAYYSTNGITFQYVHGVFVSMQSCIDYGLAAFTYLPGQQADATFSNVTISGTPAPNAQVPGITEETQAKFQQGGNLYPNPANNIVNITFEDGLATDAIVTLRNQLGQVIEQRELRAGDFTSEWNVSTFADGLYLFEIRQDNGEMEVLRLIKTK